MSRKETVMCGGHRWAFVPAHRQALPPLPSMKSEGQQKSPFSLRGAAAAHQHPFGCKAGGCTCGLVLLLGELRRRAGPETGVKKAFGEPQR